MGYFDDIVPPDSASFYFPTPPGVPRITVRPKGVEPSAAPPQLDDMSADVGLAPDPFEPWGAGEAARGNVAPSPRTAGLYDDIVSPAARHKAAIERALSTTVPLRLQHPHTVEIASELMADHGMPLDEALDRATMRLHAEEGTAEAGRISDVISKDAFDEAQRAPASPDLARPAPGLGQGGAATEGQARPDGEHASGDSASQGGDAAGGETISREDVVRTEQRAQSRDEPDSAAVDGVGDAERLRVGDGDEIVVRPPARPLDKAATESDRMNSEARESGPFVLEGKEQDAPGSKHSVRANGIPAEAHAPITSYAGDPVSAARAGELAQHKAAVESALSTTVPLRLQHPRLVEIAAELMTDHDMPLDEALDRATMRLNAEEGTAEAGKLGDITGKDAFDEAQRAPTSPNLAQPAQSVPEDRGVAQDQIDPDGEYSLGARTPRGAGGKAIGSEGAGPTNDRAQSGHEPASVVEGELRAEELKFGKDDRVIAQAPAAKQSTVPSALDSPKDATSESGSGLMRDIESYLGNSAAALARIPRDLSKMTGDLVSDPVDFLQRAGPSLAGLGMSVPLLRVGTPRGQPIVRIGRGGEEAVGIKPSVPKASVRMLDGTNRYPDIFTPEVIGEVKNVAKLSFTQQLQDYAAFAQATGRKFHLYVRPTTKLTGPLNEAILSGQINLKYIPRP